MKYVSIDIETTGLDPEKHQILEIGCVLDTLGSDVPVDELPSLRIVVVGQENFIINPFCLSLHHALLQEIDTRHREDTHYLKEQDIHYALHDWLLINKTFTTKNGINVAGKNFWGFDHLFLKKVTSVKFHRRALDPVNYYLSVEDEQPPNLEECCRRAGIELTDYHTAVGDARTVIELIRAGRG